MKYLSTNKTIAKKYAHAFYTVFPQSLTLSDVEKIESACHFLQTHKRTLFFLQLPQFDQKRRDAMVADLVSHFSLPEHCASLLLLLIKHNRSFYIPDVLWFIAQHYKEQTNSVDFSITSAHHLDGKQIESIKQFLQQRVRKNIIQTTHVDPSLIAGLRLESSNLLWEYSVRKQINALRALKN